MGNRFSKSAPSESESVPFETETYVNIHKPEDAPSPERYARSPSPERYARSPSPERYARSPSPEPEIIFGS